MPTRGVPEKVAPSLILATLLLLLAAPSLFAQQAPLTIAKSFTPSTVPIGGMATTAMTVTITNPNGASVSGISFSDTYPAGLVADQVGAYTCSAGSAVFTGTGWSLGNVTLGAGASCSVPILMHAAVPGQITNTTSQVTGTGVPPGGPASASLNVTAVVTPTLSGWMLLVLGMSITAVAVVQLRK